MFVRRDIAICRSAFDCLGREYGETAKYISLKENKLHDFSLNKLAVTPKIRSVRARNLYRRNSEWQKAMIGLFVSRGSSWPIKDKNEESIHLFRKKLLDLFCRHEMKRTAFVCECSGAVRRAHIFKRYMRLILVKRSATLQTKRDLWDGHNCQSKN